MAGGLHHGSSREQDAAITLERAVPKLPEQELTT